MRNNLKHFQPWTVSYLMRIKVHRQEHPLEMNPRWQTIVRKIKGGNNSTEEANSEDEQNELDSDGNLCSAINPE